jgi:hypothetical protein
MQLHLYRHPVHIWWFCPWNCPFLKVGYSKCDSLYVIESARKHYKTEKAHLEEGLDTDKTTSGLLGLQIWTQKLVSITHTDV